MSKEPRVIPLTDEVRRTIANKEWDQANEEIDRELRKGIIDVTKNKIANAFRAFRSLIGGLWKFYLTLTIGLGLVAQVAAYYYWSTNVQLDLYVMEGTEYTLKQNPGKGKAK